MTNVVLGQPLASPGSVNNDKALGRSALATLGLLSIEYRLL